MLKVSRTAVPKSRMLSMKMLFCVSKPRMLIASPLVELPFSPCCSVMPGVLRSASVSVVATRSWISSFLMTVIVCGVLTSGSLNLGDCTLSAL